MALATISALGTLNSEARATANTAFTLVTTVVGRAVVVFCPVDSATVNIASLAGGGVAVWDRVALFTFPGSPVAQSISVFLGTVTAVSSATVTATGSASLAARTVGYAWREVATSAVTANTSWVAEAAGSMNNTGSSTDLQLPTLTPAGANRAYIGYCDPNGTATPTGVTAGYTATAGTGDSMGNQMLTNLSVSTSQSPVGKQTVAGTSSTVGILLRAYEADTAVATNLNIGSGSGQNHFKLQTAFLNYSLINEYTQAQIAGGWNTDPQFVATAAGAVQFAVAAGAPTTSNSSYPRSELREMNTDGVTDMAFNALAGVHYLRGRIKMIALPGAAASPPRIRTTLCQLHDGVTNIGEMIKFYVQENAGQGNRPELRLSVWDSGSGMPKYVLNFAVQDTFDFQLKIDNTISAGWWGVYYQDLGTPVYTSLDYIADGFTNVFSGLTEYYFKTGSYPTTNATAPSALDPSELSTVELSYLQHWHTGWPTPSPAITLPKTFQFAPSFG